MSEIWKHINEGYQISNYGRARSIDRVVMTSNGPRRVKGKMKAFGDAHGYQNLHIGFGKSNLVHRFVATAFIRPPQGNEQVNHKDGNKHNNHVDNLEWCTPAENTKHATSTGLRNTVGVNNPASKFKEEQIKAVKQKYKDGHSALSLSKEFNVNFSTIRRIVTEKYWKHVTI